MAVFDTFSKRLKRLNDLTPDIFTYDEIPTTLRVQICHILERCCGQTRDNYGNQNKAYAVMHKQMATEFGMFKFQNYILGNYEAIIDFFVNKANNVQALDMIDMAFQYAVFFHKDRNWKIANNINLSIEDAIDELNIRFNEHAIGYCFIHEGHPQLIRKDNEHMHKDVVLPALQLLHDHDFAGANSEYRSAHHHYKNDNQKECLVDCLKAFESTMKTICKKMNWAYKETDTASTLISVCLNNGLFPKFMQTHLGTIKSALESAIPTVRNKMGGHGDGEKPKQVPRYYSEYLLYETATTIIFLISAYKELK